MTRLPAQCIACGYGTDEATCPRCDASTDIAAVQTLESNSVQLGFLKRGRRAPLVLAFTNPTPQLPSSATTAIWPSGETGEISQSEWNRLSPLDGLAAVHSLGAALLLAAQAARETGLLADDHVDEAIIRRVVGTDLSLCRRAALELGTNGGDAKIDALPLTATERAWLKAISLMRLHDFDGAIDQLLALPVDGYPAATALLAACRDGANEPHRERANKSIDLRLVADGSGLVERAAIAAGLDGPSAQWIDTAAFAPAEEIYDHIATPATSLLRFVLQPASQHASLSAPGAAPLEVIDDAIDKGAHLDLDSLNARPTDFQYLTARTDPDQLSDEAIAELHFESELVRRHLVDVLGGADSGPSGEEIQDQYLAGLVDLARHGSVSPAVATRHPHLASQLSEYLADPTLQTLTDDLANDESLWPTLSNGLPPESIGWNPERGSAARRLLAWRWLRHGSADLFEARWQEALESLKHAFRLSDDEDLSDEALNLMACAHWQLGNDEEAKQALNSALEGTRNPSLQVNLGLVAQNLDPETAALELARLVREANSLELRTAAALKAVSLWLTDEVPWGTEQEQGMPEPLSKALRSVAVEGITLDAFRQIVKLQSVFDDDWLEQISSLTQSPHADSTEARVYRARAAGPSELVDVLTVELQRDPTPDWVKEERDSLVEMFVKHALADESSGAGMFAYIAMEQGLPLEPEQRAMLIPLAVHGVCDYLSEQDEGGAPNDKFTRLLAEGEREARQDGIFDRFDEMYTSAWTRLAVAQALFASQMWDEAAAAYDRVIEQISGIPRRRLNMAPVIEVMSAIRDSAREIEKALRPFPSHIDGEVAEFLNDVLSNAQILAQGAEEVMK